MANMHHTLAIPGYAILLLVLWGWLPFFAIGWLIRKIFKGPMTPEEKARQFPRPAPGWLGPEVEPTKETNPFLLPSEKQKGQYDNKNKNKEAEALELHRRAIEKKNRAKQIKIEKMKMELARQQEMGNASMARAQTKGMRREGEPREPERVRTQESRHYRRA